jgi:hypothetical protein
MKTEVKSRRFPSKMFWAAAAIVLAASAAVIVARVSDSESDGQVSALCKPWEDFRSTQQSISDASERFDRYRQSLDEVKKAAAEQGRTDIVEAAERLWAEPGFDKREDALNAACRD